MTDVLQAFRPGDPYTDITTVDVEDVKPGFESAVIDDANTDRPGVQSTKWSLAHLMTVKPSRITSLWIVRSTLVVSTGGVQRIP